jgi:hypothetical protein
MSSPRGRDESFIVRARGSSPGTDSKSRRKSCSTWKSKGFCAPGEDSNPRNFFNRFALLRNRARVLPAVHGLPWPVDALLSAGPDDSRSQEPQRLCGVGAPVRVSGSCGGLTCYVFRAEPVEGRGGSGQGARGGIDGGNTVTGIERPLYGSTIASRPNPKGGRSWSARNGAVRCRADTLP